ncbi:hypothetical protein ABXV03_00330 [Streptomyces harbinensis]
MPFGTVTSSDTRWYAPSGVRRHARPGGRSAMYSEPSAPNATSSGACAGPSSGTTGVISPEAGSTALICPARNCATYSRPSGPNATPFEPHSGFGRFSRSTRQRRLRGRWRPAGSNRLGTDRADSGTARTAVALI